MDPCDPGADINDARAYLHLKMGIPKSIILRASKSDICTAAKKCKKSTGTPMPPMGYDRVGKHRIYYHNPPDINMSGKDYKTLLVGKPSIKSLKNIAAKVGLSYFNNKSPIDLKGSIIKRLRDTKTPEPLMVPIKSRSPTAKVNSAITNANSAITNAERVLNNTNASKNDLLNAADNILNSPPSATIANEINKNVNANEFNKNVNANRNMASTIPPAVQRFNRVLGPETALAARVQSPGVTGAQVRNSLQSVVSSARRNMPVNTRSSNIRRAEIEAKSKVQLAEIASRNRTQRARTNNARPQTALNQLRMARLQNMKKPQMMNVAKQQVKMNTTLNTIEQQLRTRLGNFSSKRNEIVVKAVSAAKSGNTAVGGILAKMSQANIQSASTRVNSLFKKAQAELKKAEDAQKNAEKTQKKGATPEATNAAQEASKKSNAAIKAIKAAVGMSSRTNDEAIVSALKLQNSNESKRAEFKPMFNNINKAILNRASSKFKGVGNRIRASLGLSSTGKVKSANKVSNHNTVMKELRTKMGVGALGDDRSVLEKAIKNAMAEKGTNKTGNGVNRIATMLLRVDKKKLSPIVKNLYGKNRRFLPKTNGQKELFNKLVTTTPPSNSKNATTTPPSNSKTATTTPPPNIKNATTELRSEINKYNGSNSNAYNKLKQKVALSTLGNGDKKTLNALLISKRTTQSSVN
jgi:hypothetical protein